MTMRRRLGAVIVGVVLVAGLAACGDGGAAKSGPDFAARSGGDAAADEGSVGRGGDRDAAGTGTADSPGGGAESGTATRGDVPGPLNRVGSPAGLRSGLTEVDPARFRIDSGGYNVLGFRTASARRGMCYFSETYVNCTGTAAPEIADIAVGPFTGRPGGIALTSQGQAVYSLFEGIPPPQTDLGPGEYFTFGEITCAAVDGQTFGCATEAAGFQIAGADARVDVLYGPWSVDRSAADQAPGADIGAGPVTGAGAGSAADTQDSAADPVVPAGTVCAPDRMLDEPVRVEHGAIACGPAREVIAQYLRIRETEGGGNTLSAGVGPDWHCSSPTYARSQELGAAVTCSDRTGVRIAIPL